MRKQLRNGMIALYDKVDAKRWFLKYSWCLGSDGLLYVNKRINKKPKRFSVHRLIMNAPKGCEVDHINRNRLDNRRKNLRLATRSENACNRGPQKKKYKHPYKGITYLKGRPNLRKCWVARIKIRGKTYSIGYFKTAKTAARAYDAHAYKYHGKFACLNFQPKIA